MTLIMYAAPPHINLITLGLPVIDAAGTRVTVTMNADGAMAAFGEFSAEHALLDFFNFSAVYLHPFLADSWLPKCSLRHSSRTCSR